MKKLLFGLLLSCSGSLTAGINEVVNGIHTAFEQQCKEKNYKNGMNKRESSKLIVPLLVDIADYTDCTNLAFCEVMTEGEQTFIASFVTAFVHSILNSQKKPAQHSQFVHYLLQTLKQLSTLSDGECRNYGVYGNWKPSDVELAHSKALLKAFCFALTIIINFYDKIALNPSKENAIEGIGEVTTFVRKQYRKINDLFIKKQYGILTKLCFDTVWKEVLKINVEEVEKNKNEEDQRTVVTTTFIDFFKEWQKYWEGKGSYLSQTDITLEVPFKSKYERRVPIQLSYKKIGEAVVEGAMVGGGLYYIATRPKTKKTLNRAYTFAGDHPILTAVLATAIGGTVAGVASVIKQIQ